MVPTLNYSVNGETEWVEVPRGARLHAILGGAEKHRGVVCTQRRRDGERTLARLMIEADLRPYGNRVPTVALRVGQIHRDYVRSHP